MPSNTVTNYTNMVCKKNYYNYISIFTYFATNNSRQMSYGSHMRLSTMKLRFYSTSTQVQKQWRQLTSFATNKVNLLICYANKYASIV